MFSEKDKKNLKLTVAVAILISVVLTTIMVIVSMNLLIGTALYASPEIKQRKADNFAAQSSSTPKGGVVFLGDSIIEMYDLDKHFKGKGYINRGISGDRSGGVLARLQTSVIDIAPSMIIIMVGINDMGYDVPKDEFLSNYKDIITTIQSALPECKILIQALYPLRYEDTLMGLFGVHSRTHELVLEWNKSITDLAIDTDVMLIDFHSLLSDKDGRLRREYTREGLHISNRGYEAISQALAEYLP